MVALCSSGAAPVVCISRAMLILCVDFCMSYVVIFIVLCICLSLCYILIKPDLLADGSLGETCPSSYFDVTRNR